MKHYLEKEGIISIHALREEGDGNGHICIGRADGFLSTPSARRATRPRLDSSRHIADFYPRPPRGGRLHPRCSPGGWSAISIHALREEGDSAPLPQNICVVVFLSTPSARRATRRVRSFWDACSISIHALREEGDIRTQPPTSGLSYFYPRPPRGGRPCSRSTSSRCLSNFYPRPPRGGRPGKLTAEDFRAEFLSTPSARRATTFHFHVTLSGQFLSTPSARRATVFRCPQMAP